MKRQYNETYYLDQPQTTFAMKTEHKLQEVAKVVQITHDIVQRERRYDDEGQVSHRYQRVEFHLIFHAVSHHPTM